MELWLFLCTAAWVIRTNTGMGVGAMGGVQVCRQGERTLDVAVGFERTFRDLKGDVET